MKEVKRLFIEVDIMNEYNKWQIEAAIDGCQDLSGIDGKEFWWKKVYDARWEENLFAYILEADEIYMSTSIIPIVGGTDMGSPELWYKMMTAAKAKDVNGKKVFNLNKRKDIWWRNLDKNLLKEVFQNNELYVAADSWESWERVDIKKLLKENPWK